MDKKNLLASVIEKLEEELRALQAATKAAHEAATAEENRPENEYDTRALEAGYLAQAQANRAAELERAVKQLREFPLPSFAPEDPVRVGALVEIASDGARHLHFLLPFGAGITVEAGGRKVSVVTLTSPLGQALGGKKTGDVFELKRGAGAKEVEVVGVS